MVDFGSTFTKLTAVDTQVQDIIATASHFTTVAVDIRTGYRKALALLYQNLGKKIKFDQIIACSSAAGGLKMAAIGLVEELTVEAAKRVCLGAGAKVDLVLSHHCTKAEIQEIIEKKIDIILLAGGSDGGNSECVLYNARMLGEAKIKIPIIFAGNKCCQDEIQALFDKYELDGYICENVMPRINHLNINDARSKIREIFLKRIIVAKGISKIAEEIDEIILPTPQALLQAAELLSVGYLKEEGMGELALVDIGGATTDMYSLCNVTNRSDVIVHGLEEPYAKRTVEGDLGMRYSAPGILKALSEGEIKQINSDWDIDLEAEIKYRFQHVEALPQDEKFEQVDQILAGICADRAMHRHVGRLDEIYTPMGMVYNQFGKDLSDVRYLIGTGGVVINALNPAAILEQATIKKQLFRKRIELRPTNPQFLLDQDYILASMGLLSQKEPLLALKIMKKHLKTLERQA